MLSYTKQAFFVCESGVKAFVFCSNKIKIKKSGLVLQKTSSDDFFEILEDFSTWDFFHYLSFSHHSGELSIIISS